MLGTTWPTSLGTFLHDTLLDEWRQNRRELEAKWEHNLRQFKGEFIEDDNWKKDEGTDWRSRRSVNLTKVKVNALQALVCDQVLRGGKIPFDLKLDAIASKMEQEQLTPDQSAQLMADVAHQRRLIEDEMADSASDREYIRNVLDLGIYGVTFARFTVMTKKKPVIQEEEVDQGETGIGAPGGPLGVEPLRRRRIAKVPVQVPAWVRVSPWDMFWDQETRDLRTGGGFAIRSLVSPYELAQRKGKKFYINTAIDRALRAATQPGGDLSATVDATTMSPSLRTAVTKRAKTIEFYEFWCRVPRRYVDDFRRDIERQGANAEAAVSPLAATGMQMSDDRTSGDEVEIMACMADAEVVRFAVVEPEDRPIYMCWLEEDVDGLADMGVADNMEQCQALLNGAVRAFEDNKKWSANVAIATKEEYLRTPLKSIRPGQRIPITQDCDDVRRAIQPIVIPDVGESLISVISMADRYADDMSQVPRITHGLSAEDRPQTAYESSMLVGQGLKYVGMAIRQVDNYLIEPMVARFHEHNLMTANLDELRAVLLRVAPQGFVLYMDRVVRLRNLQMLLAVLVESPAIANEFDMPKIGRMLALSYDLDADQVLKSERQKQEEAKARQMAAQQDPMAQLQMQRAVVEADKIKAEADKTRTDDKIAKADALRRLTDADLVGILGATAGRGSAMAAGRSLVQAGGAPPQNAAGSLSSPQPAVS